MPVHKVDGGWQWGHQKIYRGPGAREKAAAQGRAIGWSKHTHKGKMEYKVENPKKRRF